MVNVSSSDTGSFAESVLVSGPELRISDTDSFSGDDEEQRQFVHPFSENQYKLSPLRGLYRSLVQVIRLVPLLTQAGAMSATWQNVPDILDPYLPDKPGQMMCRLDVGFMRPGKDIPMPMVAGRAPDRVALCFFDPATDAAGRSLVLSGDRLQCLAGPVYGIWEFRLIPEVAQDYLGAHHMECQVVEVSQTLTPGSLTPFPGSTL